MSNIVFAKTRHLYDSYSDFWRLVELSGFPIVYVDEMEMDNSAITYITAPHNGEWKPHLDNYPDRKAKFVLWNLERPGDAEISDYASDNWKLVDEGYFHTVVVSDRWLATQTGFKYVPLGSHYGLGQPGAIKIYDAAHLMCYSLRRAFMFDYLTPHKSINGLLIAPNGWGDARHNALQHSRFMLNIHQDKHPIMEPLRFAIAAAYGLPIISEFCQDVFPYNRGVALEWVEPDVRSVATVLERCCLNYRLYVHTAMRVRDKMCTEYSFRSCVERYLI